MLRALDVPNTVQIFSEHDVRITKIMLQASGKDILMSPSMLALICTEEGLYCIVMGEHCKRYQVLLYDPKCSLEGHLLCIVVLWNNRSIHLPRLHCFALPK